MLENRDSKCFCNICQKSQIGEAFFPGSHTHIKIIPLVKWKLWAFMPVLMSLAPVTMFCAMSHATHDRKFWSNCRHPLVRCNFFRGSLAVLGTRTATCFFYLWTWSQDCNQASENVVLLDGLTNKSCLHDEFIFFFVPCTLAPLEFVIILSGNLRVWVCTCQALVCALTSLPQLLWSCQSHSISCQACWPSADASSHVHMLEHLLRHSVWANRWTVHWENSVLQLNGAPLLDYPAPAS